MKVLVILAALGALLVPPASPAAGVPILAAPGSWMATYATPLVVWTHGAPLEFVNLDIEPHDVVADATRPPGTGSCPPGGGSCPLFFSEQVGTGGIAPVQDLDDVPAGMYAFRCSPHPWMTGTLIVV